MRLGELAGLKDDRQVTGFAIDHRKVAPGTVFGAHSCVAPGAFAQAILDVGRWV